MSNTTKNALSVSQIRDFEQLGYLVLEDVFAPDAELAAVRAEYSALLKQHCDHWIAVGQLDSAAADLPFNQQLLAVQRAGIDYCQLLDISLPPGDIETDTPFHVGPAVFDMIRAPALLDCVQSLIGSELTSNPIQHVRIKPPQPRLDSTEVRSFMTATEWHQDKATALSEADATRMITAWVAVTDATEHNGCLQVIPGSHKADLRTHCPLPQLGIPDKLMQGQQSLPLPVRSGGVILFHPLTIHGSLANQSDDIRWSFDLRYHVTGHPSGRPMFPSFVARSNQNPDSELRDAMLWRDLWLDARKRLATESPVQIHRWSQDAAVCA